MLDESMIMEGELLPYTTSNLPEGPWLIFAPHADDEVFGMGGSMLLARDQNIDTHVVFVTDGALGGDGAGQALIDKRMEEAKQASRAMGVNSIHFYAEPDRGLRVCERLISKTAKLLEEINPRSVFFPSPLEYHPDHRATTELVWRTMQSMESFEGDAYSYEISNLAPINLLIDTTEVALEKYEIAKIYISQTPLAKYLALVQAIDTARTFSLPLDRIAAEGFFKYADKNASIEEQLTACIPPFFQGL